jgi:integrase
MPRLKEMGTIEKEPYRYTSKKTGKPKVEERFRVNFPYLKSDGTLDEIRESYRTPTEAKERLNELRREHVKKGDRLEHRNLLFRDYAKNYKNTKLRKLRTFEGESKKVDLMIEHFGDIKLDKLRREEIKNFKVYLETTTSKRTRKVVDKKTKEVKIEDASKPRSPRTVNTYLQRLRAILNEAVEDEKILTAPSFKGLIDSDLEEHRDKTVTYAEFERLLAACDVVRSNHDRKHLKIVLLGLWELGCRTEELQKILVKDINLNAQICAVWDGKRKKPRQRICYISERLRDALLKMGVMDMPEEARVFGEEKYYARSFNTAKKIAGIDGDFRLNDIRHCHITNKMEAGMDLVAVQKGVGHSAKSAMTLDIYTNLRPDYIKESHQKVEEYSRRQRSGIELESNFLH